MFTLYLLSSCSRCSFWNYFNSHSLFELRFFIFLQYASPLFHCCFLAISVFCSQVEFVKKLILEAGVVAVPGQGFFHTNLSSNEVSNVSCYYQKRYIRFAFCKSDATLAAVSERLAKLLDAAGHLALH